MIPGGNANFFIGGNSDPADGSDDSLISRFRDFFSGSSVSHSFSSPNNIGDALYTYDQADQKQDWSPSGPSTAAENIIALKQAHPDEPINIFGHSWGARSAMNLTKELSAAGITVDNVITLDPVSEDENWTNSVPEGTRWVNIYVPDAARDKTCIRCGDFIARLGNPQGFQPGAFGNFALDQWRDSRLLYPQGSGHELIVVDNDTLRFLSQVYGGN